MHKENAKIICLKFQKQEQIIEVITEKINQAKRVEEKAGFAQNLQKETGELLSCQEYDTKKLDCKNCHFIAILRKKGTDLILRAKKLI